MTSKNARGASAGKCNLSKALSICPPPIPTLPTTSSHGGATAMRGSSLRRLRLKCMLCLKLLSKPLCIAASSNNYGDDHQKSFLSQTVNRCFTGSTLEFQNLTTDVKVDSNCSSSGFNNYRHLLDGCRPTSSVLTSIQSSK